MKCLRVVTQSPLRISLGNIVAELDELCSVAHRLHIVVEELVVARTKLQTWPCGLVIPLHRRLLDQIVNGTAQVIVGDQVSKQRQQQRQCRDALLSVDDLGSSYVRRLHENNRAEEIRLIGVPLQRAEQIR